MATPTFDHCCCCVELRLGCLIWGYLELAGVVYYVVRLCLICKDIGMVIQMLEYFLAVPKEQFTETEEVIRSVGIALIVFLCFLWGIKLFFNIVFLRGLHMNNRAHVGAYLLYTFIFIIVGLITYIVVIAMLATLDKLHIPGAVIATTVVILIVIHLFMAYFWLVIRSQYCNMGIMRKPSQSTYCPPMHSTAVKATAGLTHFTAVQSTAAPINTTAV